jgi:hypothetical protein
MKAVIPAKRRNAAREPGPIPRRSQHAELWIPALPG